MDDEILVPAPVEDAVIAYLQRRLDEIEDGARVADKTHEGRCVRVINTGALPRQGRVLTQPQITLDSYDATEYRAGRLAALCSGFMFALRGSVQPVTTEDGDFDVVFAEIDHFGDAVNLPDPLDQRPRYTETFVTRSRVQVL